MLMEDDWFGHRTHTGEAVGDKDEWIGWDYALVNAVETIEALTDQNGLFMWEKEDPNAVVEAKSKIDPFKEAVDEITNSANYKPKNGETFVPEIRGFRGKELWTYDEWVASQIGGKIE